MLLRAKFHVVSSLLGVFKIAVLMLPKSAPFTLTENEFEPKTKIRSILKVPVSL